MDNGEFDSGVPENEIDPTAWQKSPERVRERLKTLEAELLGEWELVPTDSPGFRGIEDGVAMEEATLAVEEAKATGDTEKIQEAELARAHLGIKVADTKEAYRVERAREEDVTDEGNLSEGPQHGEGVTSGLRVEHEEMGPVTYRDYYSSLVNIRFGLDGAHRLLYPDDQLMVRRETTALLRRVLDQRKLPSQPPAGE